MPIQKIASSPVPGVNVYYVPPPTDVPNVFNQFAHTFLQIRSEWAMDMYYRRLDSMDPLRRAQVLADLMDTEADILKDAAAERRAYRRNATEMRRQDSDLTATVIRSETTLAVERGKRQSEAEDRTTKAAIAGATLGSNGQATQLQFDRDLQAAENLLRQGEPPAVVAQKLEEAYRAAGRQHAATELPNARAQAMRQNRERVEGLMLEAVRGQGEKRAGLILDDMNVRLERVEDETANPDLFTPPPTRAGAAQPGILEETTEHLRKTGLGGGGSIGFSSGGSGPVPAPSPPPPSGVGVGSARRSEPTPGVPEQASRFTTAQAGPKLDEDLAAILDEPGPRRPRRGRTAADVGPSDEELRALAAQVAGAGPRDPDRQDLLRRLRAEQEALREPPEPSAFGPNAPPGTRALLGVEPSQRRKRQIGRFVSTASGSRTLDDDAEVRALDAELKAAREEHRQAITRGEIPEGEEFRPSGRLARRIDEIARRGQERIKLAADVQEAAVAEAREPVGERGRAEARIEDVRAERDRGVRQQRAEAAPMIGVGGDMETPRHRFLSRRRRRKERELPSSTPRPDPAEALTVEEIAEAEALGVDPVQLAEARQRVESDPELSASAEAFAESIEEDRRERFRKKRKEGNDGAARNP